MEKRKIQSCVVTEDGEKNILEYCLFSKPSQGSSVTYGLTIRQHHNGKVVTESAIVSEKMENALRMVCQYASGCVLPMSLHELVSDTHQVQRILNKQANHLKNCY